METSVSQENTAREKGPVVATWVVLGLSWLCLLITGFGWLGWIFSFVAFILSIVVLAKGNTGTGVLLLILSIVGSLIIYFASWLIVLIGLGSAVSSQACVPVVAGFLC